jgi:hypothetical protein
MGALISGQLSSIGKGSLCRSLGIHSIITHSTPRDTASIIPNEYWRSASAYLIYIHGLVPEHGGGPITEIGNSILQSAGSYSCENILGCLL